MIPFWSDLKLLIVEDDLIKSRALRDCLNVVGVRETNIVETDTILVASQLVESTPFDGIVLDLAFHATQQSAQQIERQYLAGITVLQQLEYLRVSTPVIVATQHRSFDSSKYGNVKDIDEMTLRLRSAFPNNFKALVVVDLNKGDWRGEFLGAVRRFFNARITKGARN